jgi:hypothetical protein
MINLPTVLVCEVASMLSYHHREARLYGTHRPLKLFNQMAFSATLDDCLKVYLVALTNLHTAEQASASADPSHKPEVDLDVLAEYQKDSDGIIQLNEKDRSVMLAIYGLVKQDALGLAIEAVMQVLSEATAPKKEKLAAAAILDQLFGAKDEEGATALTDKLVVNLVSGTAS